MHCHLKSFDKERRDFLFEKLRDKLKGHSTKLSDSIIKIDRELMKLKSYEQRRELLTAQQMFIKQIGALDNVEDMQKTTLNFIKSAVRITKNALDTNLPHLLNEFKALNSRSPNLEYLDPSLRKSKSKLRKFVFVIDILKEMDQKSGLDLAKEIREKMLLCCADMLIAEFDTLDQDYPEQEIVHIFNSKTWLIFHLMHHVVCEFGKIDDRNSLCSLGKIRDYIYQKCWYKTRFLLDSRLLDFLTQQDPTLMNVKTVARQFFLEKVHRIGS